LTPNTKVPSMFLPGADRTTFLAPASRWALVHGEVSLENDTLTVDGHEVKLLAEKDPANLPWGGVDAEHEGAVDVLARSGQDDLLGAGLQVGLGSVADQRPLPG
jgi:hypothetical protein